MYSNQRDLILQGLFKATRLLYKWKLMVIAYSVGRNSEMHVRLFTGKS